MGIVVIAGGGKMVGWWWWWWSTNTSQTDRRCAGEVVCVEIVLSETRSEVWVGARGWEVPDFEEEDELVVGEFAINGVYDIQWWIMSLLYDVEKPVSSLLDDEEERFFFLTVAMKERSKETVSRWW
jgi:hypothetical protein